MMEFLMIFTLLVISCTEISGQEDCNAEQCIAKVEEILNRSKYDCQTAPSEIVEAVAPCRLAHCSEDVRHRVSSLGNEIDRRSAQAGCGKGARDCTLAQSFECAMGSANLITIAYNFQIANVTKVCIDVASILQTINVCQMCVQGLIPGWEAWSADVDLIFNISVTLGNGGCNCSRMIVDHINNINTSTSCATVRTVVNFARTIASDCAVKLINYPLKLDWLAIVDNYINFFLPFTGTFCGVVGGGSNVVANISFMLVSALFLLLLRKLKL